MSYLNLDPNYFQHPKTLRLIGLLGKGADVLPIKLWAHCAKFHVDGELRNYSEAEIESSIAWTGASGQFVESMLKVGFLDKKGSEYILHDWEEHEGHLIAFRKRAKLGAKRRWRKLGKQYTSNAKSTSKQSSLPNLPNLPNHSMQSRKKFHRFTPPGIAEVRVFFKENKFSEKEAEKFFHYYESRSWWLFNKQGKRTTQMKKWRSAAAGWILRSDENRRNSGNGNYDGLTKQQRFNLEQLGATARDESML